MAGSVKTDGTVAPEPPRALHHPANMQVGDSSSHPPQSGPLPTGKGDVALLLDSNYTMTGSTPSSPGTGPSPPRSLCLPPARSPVIFSPSRGSLCSKRVFQNMPAIAESSSLVTPATSPDLPSAICPTPPGMSPTKGKHNHGPRGEVVELVLRLREERQGNLLMAKRIKELEKVVDEMKMEETKRKDLEWSSAALLALAEPSSPPRNGTGSLNVSDEVQMVGPSTEISPHADTFATTSTTRIMSNGSPSLDAQNNDPSKYDEICQTQYSASREKHLKSEAVNKSLGGGRGGRESGDTKSQDQIEQEQTQKAKWSALQYKVSSLTEEIELINTASDERERKHMLALRELTDELHSQDRLVSLFCPFTIEYWQLRHSPAFEVGTRQRRSNLRRWRMPIEIAATHWARGGEGLDTIGATRSSKFHPEDVFWGGKHAF